MIRLRRASKADAASPLSPLLANVLLDEVDQALETVRRNIVKFLTVREDPGLLKLCPEHLHQVSGVRHHQANSP